MPTVRRKADEAEVAAKAHAALDTIAATPEAAAGAIAEKTSTKTKAQQSKLPPAAQFPLAATLSFAIASLGYSLLGEVSKGELARVSRTQDSWGEVGVLAGWRIVELALGWFGQLDSLDVAMLDLLSHGPSLYLLSAFYTLSPYTALSALAVDVVSVAVPFYLLRPLSAVHSSSAAAPASRDIVVDLPLQLYTAALSTAIYTVTLVLSLRFLLPRILVLHFSGLPTLEPAYAASYTAALPVTVLFGAAASTFIFPPFAAAGREQPAQFDPVEASLSETVRWNVWGYTDKTKVVVRRTAAAVFVTAVNTYLACTMTIYGIESAGAAAYAAVWAVAAVGTGLALGLVGGE